MKVRCDIFCSVIDNFGDIGVTWRLARQLATEQQYQVRLWVDDLQAFYFICPQAKSANIQQQNQKITEVFYADVQVLLWQKPWQLPVEQHTFSVADMVIEAFACELPQVYLEFMQTAVKPPLWLNLEYLSAEDWVDNCHALPSMQNNGLKKFFFFPGFTAKTGGLLREKNLIEQRQAFSQNKPAQAEFLKKLGVNVTENTRVFSLFAYENPSVASWLSALATSAHKTLLLVPQGKVVTSVSTWLKLESLCLGQTYQQGNLTIQLIPFVSQQEYDYLLWCCDFNAVRGEDSFVRAQWAAKPFVWHIYPQEENIHLDKLSAFLDRYNQGLSINEKQGIIDFWQGWNTGADVSKTWQFVEQHFNYFEIHAKNWCEAQLKQTNLAQALADFHRNWL